MENKEKIEVLVTYLNALVSASKADVMVFEEIRRTIAKIEQLIAE